MNGPKRFKERGRAMEVRGGSRDGCTNTTTNPAEFELRIKPDRVEAPNSIVVVGDIPAAQQQFHKVMRTRAGAAEMATN